MIKLVGYATFGLILGMCGVSLINEPGNFIAIMLTAIIVDLLPDKP